MGRGGKGVGERCAGPPAEPAADARPVLLAMGVISAPANTFRRDWLRRTMGRFAEAGPRGLVVRYVLGLRGHQYDRR